MIVRHQPKKICLSVKGYISALKRYGDNFLIAMADVYGVKLTHAACKDSITITYADLTAGSDLNNPGNRIAAKKKIFFETDDDNPELFLNIDVLAVVGSL